MADAIVSLLFEDLFAMAKDKASMLVGVEDELEKLSSIYTQLQAELEKAERQKKQLTDDSVRDLLGKLKGVTYEMEDIVDEWKFCNCSKVRPYSLSLCLCFEKFALRYNIGTRIRDITKRLKDISTKSFIRFDGDRTNETESLHNTKGRQTGSQGDEFEFFGRDDDKNRIIEQLFRQTNQVNNSVSIVTIVGMPGLGKTTLARRVCKEKCVEDHFERIIWVSLSNNLDVHKIAEQVITQMGGSTSEKPDLNELQTKLLEVGRMRFLLVLDDVWHVKDSEWDKLRVSLKGAAQGSKIVVTTCNCKVASVMRATFIHNLDILPVSECLQLFKYRALEGAEDEDFQEWFNVGEEIVEKCKGIPLAVWALGCQLGRERKMHIWKDVLKSNIFEEDIRGDGNIAPTFLLSYYNLPLHLKRCFSFCSVFPKNHEIKKDELVKLWMAHGIIKSKRVEIEEIGERYFEELWMHSLFHDAETDDTGNIVKCKMHDLVRELAKFVTLGVHDSKETESSELYLVGGHHLSILVKCDVPSIPSLQFNAERLRTLLLLGGSRIEKIGDCLFKHLRFLRALDLSRTDIENLPSSIGKLKHLRYLSLCDSKIKELPEFLTELCNLETLKLNHCQRLCTLPSTMSKMVKLRHLEIECTEELKSLPNGLGSLTTLRTLSKFPVGDQTGGCKIRELKNLNLLRGNLEIQNLERLTNGEEAREAELDKKSDLHSLSLHCEGNRILADGEMERMKKVFEDLILPHSNSNELKSLKQLKMKNYVGSEFPWWLEDSRPSSLVNIHLSDCKKCVVLPGLGRLSSLKYLKICGADEVKVVGGEFYGGSGDGSKGAFPKLEELYFDSMLNWVEWELIEEYRDAMPSLKKLEVSKCHKLKALPDLLPSNLSKLVIHDCGELTWTPGKLLLHLEHSSVSGNVSSMQYSP